MNDSTKASQDRLLVALVGNPVHYLDLHDRGLHVDFWGLFRRGLAELVDGEAVVTDAGREYLTQWAAKMGIAP